MADPAPEAPRIYPISPRRRWLLAAIWGLFTLPLVIGGLIAGDAAALASGGIAGLVLGLIFLLTAWRHPRLVLSRDGVVLHHLGYDLATDWANLAALHRAPGQAGLVLRQPLSGRGAERLARAAGSLDRVGGPLRPYPPEVLERIAARCYIPIEPFRYWLSHGDLERRLIQHAPWLAAGEPTAAPPAPESMR